MSGIVYNFTEIFRIMRQIDEVQKEMNDTISKMKKNSSDELSGFVGQASRKLENFFTAFDAEKGRLFKLLDETQKKSREHVQEVQDDEYLLGQQFGRTTDLIGGP